MKTFQQFINEIKTISYPSAIRHRVYDPLTGKSKILPSGKAMPKNPGGGGNGNGNGD